jgi:hypothetical protein
MENQVNDKNNDESTKLVDQKNNGKDYKNAKERMYDKIPISLKTLDIIITILITILVLVMVYFILRKMI